jgi:hypothetical protein
MWLFFAFIEVIVMILITIIGRKMNVSDPSEVFYKCRVSKGGYEWYQLTSSPMKGQAFEFLNIFLSITFIV